MKKEICYSFNDFPKDFSHALSKNISAMQIFAQMTDENRTTVIEKAKNAKTKQEMKNVVAQIKQIGV